MSEEGFKEVPRIYAVDYQDKNIINVDEVKKNGGEYNAYDDHDKFGTWEAARQHLVMYYADLIEKSKEDIRYIFDLTP